MPRPTPNEMGGYIPNEGTIAPVVPNKYGKMMADALHSGKEFLDKAQIGGRIPFTDIEGYIGAGELLMGEAPRLADDMAHGDFGIKRTGHGYNLDPAYPDLLGVAAVPAAAGRSALRAGARSLNALRAESLRNHKLNEMFTGPEKRVADSPANVERRKKAMDMLTDPGRRNVLKIGAAGAVAAASPTLAIKALREGGVTAAKGVGTVAAKGVISHALVKSSTANILVPMIRRLGKGQVKHLTDDELYRGMDPDMVKALERKMEALYKKYGDEFDLEHYTKINLHGDDLWETHPYSKEKYHKFNEMLDNDPKRTAEAIERYEATGKFAPKDKDVEAVYNGETWDELKFLSEDWYDSDFLEGERGYNSIQQMLSGGAGGPQ